MFRFLLLNVQDKSGFEILTVIGDTFDESTCDTLLANSSQTALFWYDYSNYAGVQGAVSFTSTGQLITGPRYILSFVKLLLSCDSVLVPVWDTHPHNLLQE